MNSGGAEQKQIAKKKLHGLPIVGHVALPLDSIDEKSFDLAKIESEKKDDKKKKKKDSIKVNKIDIKFLKTD